MSVQRVPGLHLHLCIYIQEVVIGMGMEASGGDTAADRCESQMSSLSESKDICRICHCEGEEGNKLISPCLCLGSLRYVHLRCLQKWIKSSEKISCELCRFEYIMTTKTKPFTEVWGGGRCMSMCACACVFVCACMHMRMCLMMHTTEVFSTLMMQNPF